MSANQIFQSLLAIPARSRNQLGTLKNRVWSADKPRKEPHIIRTSLGIHRPVWFTGGGAAYTTMAAVYLTLRAVKRLR